MRERGKGKHTNTPQKETQPKHELDNNTNFTLMSFLLLKKKNPLSPYFDLKASVVFSPQTDITKHMTGENFKRMFFTWYLTLFFLTTILI